MDESLPRNKKGLLNQRAPQLTFTLTRFMNKTTHEPRLSWHHAHLYAYTTVPYYFAIFIMCQVEQKAEITIECF